MITHDDQLNLFMIISKRIKRDVAVFAFGGTAMMFYGFKDETKDIDLFFEDEKNRNEFIKVIETLNFRQFEPFKIYIPEKLREKHRPFVFKRADDYRFDLFVKKIFRTRLSQNMKKDLFAIHEFKDKFNFRIKIFRTEFIVMLKSVTGRINDFNDIRTIVESDKNFDWQYLINEVIWQHKHGDTWIILDMEKMLKELKEYIYLESKYIKQLHKAQS